MTQAISFERLARPMDEVFGVTISEGAIANLLARAEAPMIIAAEKIAEEVRSSAVVASDETSAGQGQDLVAMGAVVVDGGLSRDADSRGAKVVIDFLWVPCPKSGSPTAMPVRTGTGLNVRSASPICCAIPNMPSTRATPPLRPASNASSCAPSPSAGGARPSRSARSDLDRRLTRLLGQPPTTSASRKLACAIRKRRNDLFVFVTRCDVPYTNNGCERALRPSVIFRKVTGCF
jgi:transposase